MSELTLDIDKGDLTINTKPIVKIKTSLEIVGTGTELPIEIVGDFTDVPTHLHEMYFDSFTQLYVRGVKVYNNTEKEPQPMTIKEKKRDWRLNRLVDIFTKTFKS